jgi:nitrile hydratase accessory protein
MTDREAATHAMPLPIDGATFDNPWQARAFALAVALNEAGHLDWPAWTKLLGEEIAKRSESGSGVENEYYACWIAALEKACTDLPEAVRGERANS